MHSFYLPPGKLDAVTVTGPDAARLLQGQLTCDVEALPDRGITRGALCNNKGRVITTLILVRHGTDFHIVLHEGMGTIFMQALKKYQPFYKCELQLNPGPVWGLVGADLAAGFGPVELPPSAQCRPLADGWICTLDDAAQQFIVLGAGDRTVPASGKVGTLDDWLIVGLSSGQFPFTAEDTELYTPQELHLDRHGYVSFTKGCYTGQEIVARMHYRGKLKKLLFLLEAPGEVISLPHSMEILDMDGSPVGTSFKTLNGGGMQYVLAPLPAEFEGKSPAFVTNRAGLRFSTRVF